jgi:hypothetical protein
MEIREELPDCHVYIYYMDIRTFGLYETKYYWKSQEEFKVKYIKARIAEVTSNGEKLIVKGEDTLVKRPITIPFDLVVHAIGMDPNVDNKDLSAIFGVDLEPHGFIGKASSYSACGLTNRTVSSSPARPPAPNHRRFHRPGQGGRHGALEQRQLAARLVAENFGGFLTCIQRPQPAVPPERPRLELSGPAGAGVRDAGRRAEAQGGSGNGSTLS